VQLDAPFFHARFPFMKKLLDMVGFTNSIGEMGTFHLSFITTLLIVTK
jgi:hypothetical protein